LLAGVFEQRDGRSFFIGLGAWALLRAVISLTWRDPTVVLGLNAGGFIAVGVVVTATVAFVWIDWLGPRRRARSRLPAEGVS